MSKNIVATSKFLSKYLRHAPEELGLELKTGGWASVDDLLIACKNKNFPISYDELVECVEKNDKKRFSFDLTGDWIRANQGHSIEIDLQLEPKQPPDVLYHGTADKFVDSIFAEGINKGNRHHVHLSIDVATAKKVGSRRGKPKVFHVDALKMSRQGFIFYCSDNGVWLTEFVPPDFLLRDLI